MTLGVIYLETLGVSTKEGSCHRSHLQIWHSSVDKMEGSPPPPPAAPPAARGGFAVATGGFASTAGLDSPTTAGSPSSSPLLISCDHIATLWYSILA